MLLETIHSPEDIKNYSQEQLEELTQEIRSTIIKTVGQNGGHLASNLGVVELTVALHRIFDSPKDAIIWDVSHQCYTHKLLTGRYNQFNTLRKNGGLSGFTNKNESEHDFFIHGHSSTSISAALGLLSARALNKTDNDNGKVIAVIGDGALTGGMAFEGLSNAGQLCKNLIVVLNDNQMSIDHNTGAVSRYLSSLTMTSKYQNFRQKVDRSVEKTLTKRPNYGKYLNKIIYRFKRSLKGLLLTNNLFTDLGFEYVGPLDGHNIQNMEKVFRRVKMLNRPVVVHVVTKKGKGYAPAEENPDIFHGIGPFNISDGASTVSNDLTFTKAFGKIIVDAAENNPQITAITAAMAKGTGLTEFSQKYPERFFDVGIAEEHAVTFAGGLAEGGAIPVVCIYSTFMQRSVDQMIHDIALQNVHCVFCLDRAGAVPEDGVTHQGIFDIALFKPIPGLTILSPSTAHDLKKCFNWAVEQKNSVVIRYPKLVCPEENKVFEEEINCGKGLLIKADKKADSLIVCTGGMYSEVCTAAEQIKQSGSAADIFTLRFIKPFDEEYFTSLCKNYNSVIFVEDGIVTGGISQELNSVLLKAGFKNTKILAFEDKFYEHGTRQEILEAAGLSVNNIIQAFNELN